jgi:serine/threonine protein kinase
LICGRPPISGGGKETEESLKKTLEKMFEDKTWDTISKGCKDFIRDALTIKYTERPSASKLLDYEWIKNRDNLPIKRN